MKISKNAYDFNLLLRVINVLICGLCVYLYNIMADSVIVNTFTIVLVVLFAVENVGMLSYEKKRRNPYIIIIVLVGTLFYMARVATIIHIPDSVSLWEGSFIPSATELNYALIFILLANAAMFAGFYVGRNHIVVRNNITCENHHVPKIYPTIIIITTAVLIDFFNVISAETFGRLIGYVQSVLSRYTIILFTFTMMAYYYNKISLRARTLLIVIIIAIVLLTTLSGSRSGILNVGMLLLMSILVVKQRVLLNKNIIFICLIIIPISIYFFTTATLKKQLGIQDTISVEQLYVAKESGILDFDSTDKQLSPIYNRLGFLDWSTELIINSGQFSTTINGPYYFKSIIDNVLTPGFDVFGTPLASHALSYVKRGEHIPAKSVISQFYQSDQMGIYGEYYVLFYGYPALVVFFFLAFILQRAFDRLRTTNNLRSCLYRVVLLNLFYVHMNSFGIDWLAFNAVTAIITTFLFARFYV